MTIEMTLQQTSQMPIKDLEKILTELGKASSVEIKIFINEIDEFIKKYFQKHFNLKPEQRGIKQIIYNVEKEKILKMYKYGRILFKNITWIITEKPYTKEGFTITLNPYSSDLNKAKGNAAIYYDSHKFRKEIEKIKNKLENYKLNVAIHHIGGHIL
jgi:hypothetical protein